MVFAEVKPVFQFGFCFFPQFQENSLNIKLVGILSGIKYLYNKNPLLHWTINYFKVSDDYSTIRTTQNFFKLILFLVF